MTRARHAPEGQASLLAPTLLCAALAILWLLDALNIVPSVTELSQRLAALFERYGLPLVAACAFLESLPGVNAYFPGSVPILLAMALTHGDPAHALATYAAIVLPAIAGNLTSYWLGTLARKRGSPSPQLTVRVLLTWYATTYWHPHFAAVTAYASGSSAIPFRRYLLFLPISIVWSAFWSFLAYSSGIVVGEGMNLAPLVLVYALVWMLRSLRAAHRASSSVGTDQVPADT